MSLKEGVAARMGKHFQAKCLKQTSLFGFKVTACEIHTHTNRPLSTKHKFAYFNYSCIFKIDKKCCGRAVVRSRRLFKDFWDLPYARGKLKCHFPLVSIAADPENLEPSRNVTKCELTWQKS